MGVVSAPLFSLTASGTIGKALTYSKWKGIKYVRTRVVPANPKTAAQKEVRAIFANLNLIMETAPFDLIDPFNHAARGRPLTGRNLFVSRNAANLQGQTDISLLVPEVGQNPIPLPPAGSLAAGAGSVTFTGGAPTNPTDWTVDAGMVIAIADFDPGTVQASIASFATEDLATPFNPALAGLDPGDYIAAGFYRAANNAFPTQYRYGPPVVDFVTVT